MLRRVLSQTFDLHEAASHDPNYLLGHMPERTVVQVHSAYSREAEDNLRGQDVIIVCPTRHHLDTLLSMLHFAQFEPEVDRWLGGAFLADLPGCDPTSKAFRAFACGTGSRDLLAVSAEWSSHADVSLEYGESASDPLAVLRHQPFSALPRVGSSEHVREASDFEMFHQSPNMHGWMGYPGYWTRFISRTLAEQIAHRNTETLAAGGYSIDGARDLSDLEIRLDWAASFAGDCRSAG